MTITVIHGLAAASPEPDFVMLTQQSLTQGRRAGILCGLGISLGLAIHIAYSAAGMAVLVVQSAAYFFAIKILGAAFLIDLGIKGLCSRSGNEGDRYRKTDPLSSWQLISKGFICNTLNPKVPLYFLSLFTLVLSPDMPWYHICIISLWIMVIQFLWFLSVALLLSKPYVRHWFQSIGHWVDRVMGALW